MTAVAVTAAVAAGLAATGPTPPTSASTASAERLYLVTLTGPGAAGAAPGSSHLLLTLRMHAEQDRALQAVGAGAPAYRWTDALNGVAVRLSAAQATALAHQSRVALVEPDRVVPLAGRAATTGLPRVGGLRQGGAGVVVGVVDSGVAPDSPLFASVPGLGRKPPHFHGSCQAGEGWPESACNRKLVAARWFVKGFGADRIRSTSSLSALDDDGHGTQVASVAAGNAGAVAEVRGQRLGTYAGVAPQARLAVYKACWTAPDPDDDGCATADLVSAIDAATADGVDVLNLSLGGPARVDTVERALLGAAESGAVVVGAAGNTARATAAHPDPWVTTVGATDGPVRTGRVALPGGTSYGGAMAADRVVGPARLVLGADVAAAGSNRREARVCTPGSLDAAEVRGRVVLCDRGVIGRVDKSAAVAMADGVGMVLANVRRSTVVADFHSVPTVHVDRAAGRALRHWARTHPHGRVTLDPAGRERPRLRVAPWSSPGDPDGAVVKPDLVTTGSGVLGAVPPDETGQHWDLASGTSVATAITSGTAAVLLSRHRQWSAAAVRSALATTAQPVPGASRLRAGAGRLDGATVLRPGLVYDVAPRDYRAWLTGRLRGDLNTPSVLLADGATTAERTVTNVAHRRLYFSSHAYGFERHRVRVTPAAVRLGPGESATFTVTATGGGPGGPDDGWVTWRGATGTVTRMPVVVNR